MREDGFVDFFSNPNPAFAFFLLRAPPRDMHPVTNGSLFNGRISLFRSAPLVVLPLFFFAASKGAAAVGYPS